MAKPQVTITLGSSGQKVVKDSWGFSDGSRAVAALPTRSKRSLQESLGSSAFNSSKRMRDGESRRSYGNSSRIYDDVLSPKDLRLKLTHKRMSREAELKKEKFKGIELHDKVSRAIQSAYKLPKGIPYRIPAAEAPTMDSSKSSYASWTSTRGGTRSPKILRLSEPISNPSSAIDERVLMPSTTPYNPLRRESVLTNNPLVSSRPMVPMVTEPRRALDSSKLPTELPTVAGSGSISRTPHQSSLVRNDSQLPTVRNLLHSLGLGKYYINFQAEEVDMVVLKQMGEVDLKELGIPMGPRKKILHALIPRPAPPPRTNHLQ